jgi:hypothetical protein
MRHKKLLGLIGAVCGVLGVYYAPSLLASSVSMPFTQTLEASGKIRIHLARAIRSNETVFFSAERPRGPCRLLSANNEILFSNSSGRVGAQAEPLDELFVGGTIVGNGVEQDFTWQCENLGGFGPKREFDFSFAPRLVGELLYASTIAVDSLIGLFIAVLMVLLGIYFYSRDRKPNNLIFLFLALTTLIYSCSLSNITHLFVSQNAAFFIHINIFIISRAALALWIVNVASRKTFATILLIVEIAFVLLCINLSPNESLDIYRTMYGIFTPLLVIGGAWKSSGIKRNVAYVWLALALFDSIVIYVGFGKYPAPIAFAFLNCYIGYIQYKQDYFLSCKEKFTSQLARLLPSYTTFESFLSDLVSKTWQFQKIKPAGYFIDSSFHNNDIPFGHESAFFGASCTGNKDHLIKLNFAPFGGVYFDRNDAFIEEFIFSLQSGVESVSKIVTHLVFPNGDGFQPIIEKFGQGIHKGNIVSCVIDINDYSIQAEKFGSCYRDLVLKEIIPVIRECFGDEWVVESNRGDEVAAFLVCPIGLQGVILVKELEKVLCSLFALKHGKLSSISEANGFDPISISTGLSHGETSLIIDPIGVRMSSVAINTAKRLQERATKGSFLVSASTAELINESSSNSGIKFSAPFEMIVKKNLVQARKILSA